MITYKCQFISFFCNLGRIGQVLMFSKRPNLLAREDYFLQRYENKRTIHYFRLKKYFY